MTSWRLGTTLGLALVIAVLGVRLFEGNSSADVWHALRAAGFVTYLLFWTSAMTGMAFYLRLRVPPLRQSALFEIHRVTGVLAAAFLAAHLVAVLVDPWINFGLVDVLVGATAPYRPLALFFGAAAAWSLGIVTVTTATAGRFLYATWLNIHRLAFPGYVLALLHGLLAGTDSPNPLVLSMYGLTAGAVAGLGVLRLAGRVPASPPATVPGR